MQEPQNRNLIWQQLGDSEAVRRYQSAFTVATGLPLTLIPAGLSDEPSPEARGAFCIDGCMGERSGKLCLSMVKGAERRAAQTIEPVQFGCPSGLIKVLVPVVIGGQHAGNLLAGPFSLAALNSENIQHLTHRLHDLGLEGQMENLKSVWSFSPVVSSEKVQAIKTLVSTFAQFLSETGNRLIVEDANKTSPLLKKIEAFLNECGDEAVSLKTLAQKVSLSPCHFCKLFKKQTGLTFTEYRVRRRIEKARELLHNRELRIGEVAFQAGFESLPYFNRVFRRYVGCSPSQYRASQGSEEIAAVTKQDKRMQTQA